MTGLGAKVRTFVRRSVFAATLAAAAFAAPAGAAERPGLEESRAFVEKLVDDAVRTWGRDHPSDEARFEAMKSLIHSAFAVDFITRAVLGRAWRSLDAEQQATFKELFPDFVVQVYLPHLVAYDRDHLRILGARPRGKRDAIVLSEIRNHRGAWHSADWRIRTTEHGIRVIDIVVAGVSLLLVQRQEFEAVIKAGGFESLVELLRDRLKKVTDASG